MASRPVIIFMASLYCLCSFADGRVLFLDDDDDEDAFLPMCSRMCDASRDFRDNVLFPYKCSCSQSCTVFDDCCYDSPYKGPLKPSEFVCVSVDGLGDFRAVSSCPRSQRSDSCGDLLGYLPPVTSRATNITYANVFCASCNDDGDDLTRWNVHLRCSSKTDGLMYSFDFSEITYKDDEFRGRNPRERTWRPCKFYVNGGNLDSFSDLELRPCNIPPKVSRCSPTWRDPSVKQECGSYVDPVFVRGTPFRNSHCARCNYRSLEQAECIPRQVMRALEDEGIRSCIDRSRHQWHQCMYEMGRGGPLSLASMFDFYRQRTVVDTGCLPPEGKRCCQGEKFDKNTGMCRRTRKG